MCVLFLRQHTAPLHCKADVPERRQFMHEERPDHQGDHAGINFQEQAGENRIPTSVIINE